jgi:hypothetical protein
VLLQTCSKRSARKIISPEQRNTTRLEPLSLAKISSVRKMSQFYLRACP